MMDSTLTTADGTTFRIEQDYVEYRTLAPQRDPDWRAIDSNGHEHYMQDGGYPTLEWVEDEPYWCEEHGELHEQGHRACRICGEEVSPGMRPPDPWPQRVPTMRHFYINDKAVPEAEFNAVIERENPR